MTSRVLPPDEYAKLAGTELEQTVPFFPEDTRIIVVEDGGAIVGSWGLMRYLHAEGLDVRADHRKLGVVGRHLYDRMQHEAAVTGDRVVLTAALSEDVARLIRKVGGAQLPGTHYVMPIGAR